MSILDKVVSKFGNDFDVSFEEFADANAAPFYELGNCKATDHPLELKQLHQEFCDLFEHELESYIKKQDYTFKEFIIECEAALEADTEEKFFIEFILAATEYDRFYGLMRNHAALLASNGKQMKTNTESKCHK